MGPLKYNIEMLLKNLFVFAILLNLINFRCKIPLASCSDGCLSHGSFNGVPMYDKPLQRSRWVMDEHLARAQVTEAIR